MKINLSKQWKIDITFSNQEKEEIKNNTAKWRYYKDLKNFYNFCIFTDLIHKDIEIDFATRYKIWKTIKICSYYDFNDLILDIDKKLQEYKKYWKFEEKLIPEEIFEYYFDFENWKIENIF